MATILKPGPTTDGCYNCTDSMMAVGAEANPLDYSTVIPGIVEITEWDEQGTYTYLGRCYYCNHRDRPPAHDLAIEVGPML